MLKSLQTLHGSHCGLFGFRQAWRMNLYRAASSCSVEAHVSTKQHNPELPVLTHSVRGCRHLILNRPSRLNAMNLEMKKLILGHLQTWEKSDDVDLVLLKGNGRALCAGGDVRDVVKFVSTNDLDSFLSMMQASYQMIQYIATMEKPYLAIMDGITMGGGAGLSVHGTFRIATENTQFAMPETAIGLFPDVGSSFYLSRLDGQLGCYLALTGQSIKAQDVLFAGIATHFVPSARLPALEQRLAEITVQDTDHIDAVLNTFAEESGHIQPDFTLRGEMRRTIDRCFKHDTVEEILDALNKDASPFALETLNVIRKRSPTAVKLTLEHIREGRQLGVTQCLQMEFKSTQKMMRHHDFTEGVTSHLIHKRQPRWNPPTLEQVQGIRAEFFDAPVSRHLVPLRNVDYTVHPYRQFTLPSENDVRTYMANSSHLSYEDIVNHFLADRKGKFGVLEKVSDILDRKTKKKGNVLEWTEECQ